MKFIGLTTVLTLIALIVHLVFEEQVQIAHPVVNKPAKRQPLNSKLMNAAGTKLMEISLPPPPPVMAAGEIKALKTSGSVITDVAMREIKPLRTDLNIQTDSRIRQPVTVDLKIEPIKPVFRAPKETMKQKDRPVSKDRSASETPKNLRTNTINAKKTLAEGRPLLRLLEHGKGPSIEIFWPEVRASRRLLYTLFKKCYGMRIAVIDRQGNVFDHISQPGRVWSVNLDRYSGFMRQSLGGQIFDEQLMSKRIREHHNLRNATTVRFFPRQVDAFLLGGFKNLGGSNSYDRAQRIQARYQVLGGGVFVRDIRFDNRPVVGEIDLSRGNFRRCGV